MVLYHDDGRAVKAHEDYLEKEAQKLAKNKYENQSDALRGPRVEITQDSDARAWFSVKRQEFWTLYTGKHPMLDAYRVKQYEEPETRIPKQGVHKATLMKSSGYAQQYFTFHPDRDELPLPIKVPRRWGYETAAGNPFFGKYDPEMAYITRETVEKWIIPWLDEMKVYLDQEERDSHVPQLLIDNNTLLDNIYLYGATLQLGLPKFIQKNLIQVLCEQLYKEQLVACHLEALEIAVARFHSHAVPILDPVLNHLVGTYALREAEDRQRPGTPERPKHDPTTECHPPQFLDYVTTPGQRVRYPDDTYIVPPRLPVIGHCIRHWSGIRRNGDVVAAHTGYPLNVGFSHKPFDPPIKPDYYGASTYLLREVESLPGKDTTKKDLPEAHDKSTGRSGPPSP